MIHKLKILNCYYEAVKAGIKTFEIRRNSDRGFQKGDQIVLMAIHGDGCKDLAEEDIRGEITYVTNYEQKEDYVVFGFKVL